MYDQGFSVQAAAERLKLRELQQQRERAARRIRAQSWAREIAHTLGTVDPTLERVIGFGSTFEPWRSYREDSDIDLGIDLGIESGDWSLLMGLIQAELRQDYEFIALNYRKNRAMTSRIGEDLAADEFDYAALGYTIHNLYSALESYFLRIAKFFENNLDEHQWHRSLVHRMTLDIEGVRPALFDPDYAARIEELMRFRHLFRNLYKTPLVPQKVLLANDYAATILDDFTIRHQRFDQFLRDLKTALVSG